MKAIYYPVVQNMIKLTLIVNRLRIPVDPFCHTFDFGCFQTAIYNKL